MSDQQLRDEATKETINEAFEGTGSTGKDISIHGTMAA